jgi:lysophospholipase L1-like esterase
MPRERRSKYANDAVDNAQLASSLAQSITDVQLLNFDSALRKYRSAIAKVESGTNQLFNVNFVGDSITEGVGIDSANDYYSKGYVGRIREKFKTKFGDVGLGMIPVYTSAWTFNGDWITTVYGIGTNAKYTKALNATAQISFSGTGISFVLMKGGATGSISVTIDGSPATINYSVATGQYTIVSITGLTDGVHTAVLTNLAAVDVYLSGAFEIKGTKGIRVNMCGKSGAISNSYSGYEFSMQSTIDVFAPSLTVIALITNDIGFGTTVDDYKANIQKLITRAKTFGDVLLLANTVRTDRTDVVQKPFVDVLRTLAVSNNCAFVNIYNRWGIQGNTLGFMADTLHPSEAGHQDMANALLKVLLEA